MFAKKDVLMVSFVDLPKDVIWLIFQRIIKKEALGGLDLFECGCRVETELTWPISILTCDLALISKESLRLVRSKCYRYREGWLFIKGALT